MTLPRYGEYKDSLVEWLGKVPRHWKTGKIRRFARLKSGHTPSRQHPEYWHDCTIPWFSLADVWQIRDGGARYVHETSELVSELGLANSSARLLPKGTVILSRTASVGFSAIMARDMATTQDFANWVCGPDLRPEYLLYGFRAMKGDFDRLMMGSTHQTIYMPDIAKLALAVPPLPEQDAIIVFLDRETGKIDALVAEQEKLIALLKEKRQAVVSHAVTKGLDPAAPMKDSGIEWLGEVPAHWNVSTVGRACGYISYGFTNPMPTEDEGPYLLTANDIEMGRVRFETARRTSQAAFDNLLTGKSRPCQGDLLLTKDGTLGRIAVHDGTPACINQSVALLRPNPECVLPLFFASALSGSVYQERMVFEAGGTTIKHIYISRLAKMPLVVPPRHEQRAILDYLDAQCAILDPLVEDASRAVGLLKERRTALISAAVTGKIDVRGLVDMREAA